jgi:hypothetical protein
MKIKLTITICALLLALAIFSCDNPVTLGKKLNMDPPVVTIITPDFMRNIKDTVEITGIATDLEEIVAISISIERISESGTDWKREWHAERGLWTSRNNVNSAWEYSVGEGIWIQQGGKGNIVWSVRTSTEGAPSGEYLITAGAENNVKNEGAKTTRRVVIDNEEPTVEVLTPDLDHRALVVARTDFDSYRLQDFTVLDKLHNKWIRIQYKVEDNFSLASLMFQLTDNEGKIYYNAGEKPVTDLAWSGKFEILAKDISDPDDATFPINPDDGRRYLQIISIVSDRAGNTRRQAHGWLVWFPEADKPWTEGIGAKTEAEVTESAYNEYPGTEIHGTTYDNDGVAEVSYQIYKKVGGVYIPDGDITTLTNPPPNAGEAPGKNFAWKLNAPTEQNNYMVVINCKDMYGTAGDTVQRYFHVRDISAPTVVVLLPKAEDPLFGDASGNFTISGYADDGEEVTKLALLWINPKPANPSSDVDNRFSYQSVEYTGWGKADGSTDTQGNKLWSLTSSLGANTPEGQRWQKTFTKQLNLFSNLDVGSGDTPLTKQSFLLRVENKYGRAVIVSYSPNGDSSPPVLEITGIDVNSGGSSTNYTIRDGNQLLLGGVPVSTMDLLKKGDTITVRGIWGDDSFETWKSITRMGSFTVTWNGTSLSSSSLTNTVATPPTTPPTYNWSGIFTVDDDVATYGSAEIVATLEDFRPNKTEKFFFTKVTTNLPVILSASSDTLDGYYNAAKIIDIYLEFNDDVSWTQPSSPPSLTLNTGGTANWNTGQDTNLLRRHHFTYIVGASHTTDTNRLTVTAINASGGTWKNNLAADAIVTIPTRNLANTKDIKIDTAPPTIISYTALTGITGDNYYKEGGTVILRVTVSEKISYTSGATITLNSNYNASGVAGTAVIVGSPVLTSGDTVLQFTYNVAATQNTPLTPVTPLRITGFSQGNIQDLAGNTMASVTVPTGNNITGGRVSYIDTTPPPAPTLIVIADDGNDAGGAPRTYTISGEAGATLEYQQQLSGGAAADWLDYTGERRISSPGTYTLRARQTDLAGNLSSGNAGAVFTIMPVSPLLQTYSGTSSGTYKEGQSIRIELNLREPVTVSGGTLSLTLENGKRVDLTSNVDKKLTFSFTVNSDGSDDTELLKIRSINTAGLTIMAGSTNVTSQFPADGIIPPTVETGKGRSFEDTNKIKIDTQRPILQDVTYDSATSKLTLKFNKEIYPGTGNITITHPNTPAYLAPAILTKAEYNRYGGDTGTGLTSLKTYYDLGTNGTNATGVWSTDEKYVLKYTYNNNNSDLTDLLKNRGADKVNVPVNSSAVVKTASKDSLEVTLTAASGFVLPVKGVTYTITYLEGLVVDGLNHQVVALALTTGKTLTYSGVNDPVIRIQKSKESRTGTTTTQPTTAGVKMDAQTPGSTITYTVVTSNATPEAFGTDGNNFNGTSNPPKPGIGMPSGTGGSNYTVPLTLPEATAAQTDRNGYTFGIRARASAGGVDSDYVYEVAARSVIKFNNINAARNWDRLSTLAGGTKTLHLWLRGGDGATGANLTPGFPLGWSEDDHATATAENPSGARLMTQDGNNWYWITWEVSARPAFFHFLAGTVANTGADIYRGPLDWSYGKNRWSFQHNKYPLYPGGNLVFTRDTRTTSDATEDFEFYDTFGRSR